MHKSWRGFAWSAVFLVATQPFARAEAVPCFVGADEDARLALEADLDTVVAVAQERNPDLREAQELVRAAAERVRAAPRLPDLELKHETWAVPLSKPFAFDESMMVMLGLSQS